MCIPYYSIYNYDNNIVKYQALPFNHSFNDNYENAILYESVLISPIDTDTNTETNIYSDNNNNNNNNNNNISVDIVNSLYHIVNIHNEIRHISFPEEKQYILGVIVSITILCNIIYKTFAKKN